jgi:hypothetical protein
MTSGPLVGGNRRQAGRFGVTRERKLLQVKESESGDWYFYLAITAESSGQAGLDRPYP